MAIKHTKPKERKNIVNHRMLVILKVISSWSQLKSIGDQNKHGIFLCRTGLYRMLPIFLKMCSSERKEGNVLFNDALNIFYTQLYGVKHMVKDHSDSMRGNLLQPYGLLFPISSKGSFI